MSLLKVGENLPGGCLHRESAFEQDACVIPHTLAQRAIGGQAQRRVTQLLIITIFVGDTGIS